MAEAATRRPDVPELDFGSAEAAASGSGDRAIPLDDGASEPLVAGASAAHSSRRETLEPGRSLVVADFSNPAHNAAERLIRLAYGLGIPASTLTSPFGKPARPRLLATVESPLAGDRAAGVALRAGHFLVYGVKAPIVQMSYGSGAHLTAPFERTVHGFTWLGDLASATPREQAAPTACRIMDAWLQANPKPAKGAAWKVENVGLRLLNWLAHAPLILSIADKAKRKQRLEAMASTARWLDRNVKDASDRLGELAGWCAIIAAGLLMPDGRPRRLYGEAGMARALGELVADDGGVLSRSPLAQMDAIALLVDLAACYRAADHEPPEVIESMLQLLVPPLLTLVHSDGALGSWQGSGAVRHDRLAALVDASGVRTRPLQDVRQWGYQRVLANKSTLIFDAAPPPLSRHARFGCASTLAFEFCAHGQRLVVNCGGAAFAGGQVPARIEQGLRATAAHSTLVLDDANSTAVHINGRLGAGVNEVEVDRRVIKAGQGTATRVEASHDGYAARFGLVHRRVLMLRDNGAELRGEDLLVPAGKRGKRGKIGFAIRFHIGPGVELRLAEDLKGAGLAAPDGSYWQFRIAGGDGSGEVSIEESMWVDGNGRPQPIQQLVIQGMTSRSGGSFSWLLKKMG
ncbi:heparinase II/III family protein [Parerythrobacter lacustris]|uniref:Heparinase II/III family protein n=1 Tax=Parerythrobacter lacustris TaxID=2969984 RepID=A0ABT1XL26_9SPHN|nr:heparinase II/III family protein [Parerythrobacter lacustris]MCR2832370.1 heparinase II/III family protein [Parerythrobacter lacustris]